MPPKQDIRARNLGKRPRDEEPTPSPLSTPSVAGFAAINSPRNRDGASQSSTQSPSLNIRAPAGKVAIPALKNPRYSDASKSFKKGRTAHACDFCRKSKAGCTGGNPCVRCKNANVPCIYGDGKRDKDKKKLTELSHASKTLLQHSGDVTEALRRIRSDESMTLEATRTALDAIIEMIPPLVLADEDEDAAAGDSREGSEADDAGGQDDDNNEEVGSTGSIDVVNVDTDRDDTRATGHVGKSSAVAWAKRTADELRPEEGETPAFGMPKAGHVLASYHTEDADLEQFDTRNVDCYDWPEAAVADALVQSYFDTIHKSFPLVDRDTFMSTYNNFSRGSTHLSEEEKLWLGSLNVIFAIGAVYAHLSKNPYQAHHSDHSIYLARARIICLDGALLYEDPRVQTVSALGLLCLYYLATYRMNRAWAVCGLALRHCMTLGMHVRSEAEDLQDFDKEQRVRIWWSLYSMEALLDQVIGRPSCVADRDVSTPLPANINEIDLRPGLPVRRDSDENHSSGHSTANSPGSQGHSDTPTKRAQPLAYKFSIISLPLTSSTHFIYRTQLSILSHDIVTQLYCAATINEKWADVQEQIKAIDARMQTWRDSLPSGFSIDFDTWQQPDWNDPYIVHRMSLAMMFNSTRMMLLRPFLCQFDGRIMAQSEKSKSFTKEAVESCVKSARTMVNLIGWSARTPEKLYSVTPWWNTLHYLCESLSVLMLELAYKAQHFPGEAGFILDDVKKGINWLIMMAADSISARKAWEIFDSLVRIVAPKINWSVYDLPNTAPVPPGYNWRRWSHGTGPNKQQSQSSSVPPTHYPDSAQQQADPSPTTSASWPTNPNAFTYQAPSASMPYDASAPAFTHDAVGNPLDHFTALQMFGTMGQVFGSYDEPWQDLFGVSLPTEQASMNAMAGVQSMGPPPVPVPAVSAAMGLPGAELGVSGIGTAGLVSTAPATGYEGGFGAGFNQGGGARGGFL